MIPFLIIALAASLGANAALLIVLIARRATRRPADARPRPRTDPHPVNPANPHRAPRSLSPHADIPTEIRPRIERSPLARTRYDHA